MPALGSVLVIRLSSLGDVLFAVPAVQALQRSGLAGSVSWLVEDRAAGLLDLLPGLESVLVYPRRRSLAWPAHLAALRRRRDDLVLDLQGNLKSRAHRMLLRAPRSVGYDRPLAKEGGEKGLDQRFTPPPSARHRVDAHLALVASLGPEVDGVARRPELALDPGARQRARDWCDGLPGEGPVVVLSPGTSAFGALKRWDPERFAALGDDLAATRGARLVLSAGPGEEALLAPLRRRLVAPAHRPPRGTLGDLAALLEAADLVVASDSLPLHLANALGTPVVGLYGPKSPAVTGPRWDRSRVVQSGVDCSPCTLRRCRDRLCMDRLGVPEVAAAARALIDEGAPAGAVGAGAR